jgi:hypothetical protein
MSVTIPDAKTIVHDFLDKHELPYTRLSGKTVDFTDLARMRKIFIRIHGWLPNPIWAELKQLAQENDFCVEARK